MESFVTWGALASFGGAAAMTALITQLTKNLGFVKKIPTQLWSYVIALAVLFPAEEPEKAITAIITKKIAT